MRGGAAAPLLAAAILSLSEETDPDFSRNILPILSDKCFVCHGPDTRKEGFLRLDTFENATRDRGGYRAIDPAHPERSEIIRRLQDAEDPMPPKDAEKHPSPAERALLVRWARAGGRYDRHWAFRIPERPPLPPRTEGSNPIDAFVVRKLERAGLSFAPEAPPGILARRSSLVLTGLPPDPDRVGEFASDTSPGAWECWIESLLASPRYGEHQARYWLDAVRYGDTHGLHLDNRRGIFPYRDWVVRAFNRNLPLDRFITWQLAGDLLPEPSLEEQVATGYVRMNPTTSEGGAIPLEFQAKNSFDRTENFGTVFLGLTLSCARCHNHKYDPVTQEEYYRLLAFFNNTAEGALDGNAYVHGPVVRLPRDPGLWPAWETLARERDRLLEEAAMESHADRETILSHAAGRKGWRTERWKRSRPVPLDAPLSASWKDAEGLPGRIDSGADGDRAVWIGFDAEVPGRQTLWLTIDSTRPPLLRIDGEEMSPPSSVGSGRSRIPLTLSAGHHSILIRLAGPSVEARIECPWEAVGKAERLVADPVVRLMLLADPTGPFASLPRSREALPLLQSLTRLEASLTTSLVARERDEVRQTRVLERGEYDRPQGDPLTPGIPAVLGGLSGETVPDRLDLARWTTSRENPLVARVLVNRIWQRTFGVPLVRSPENFGLQGTYPTHPELLDWLAVELQESGWDLRHMLRLMTNSRTFRQSSRWRSDTDDPENRLLARGPLQRMDAEMLRDTGLHASGLLSTHIGGEGIKPPQPEGMWQALSHPASNTKLYVADQGPRLYRRSLYTYWKRTSPHPMMTLFDAPSRESSCVRRSRTNTPLQSLGLFNETQRIEIGRALAARLIRERDSDENRLEFLFRLATCRPPGEPERTACLDLLSRTRHRYEGNPEDARALIGETDTASDPKIAEQAAWTQVALTVLASDAAILVY